MDRDTKIHFENVWKSYHVYANPLDRVKELFHASPLHTHVHALQDFNLVVRKGERIGVLGENGSGKSTLLKLIAGVATQSSGHIAVDGRVSALLELGAGFGGELTGIENIRQYGMLHGLMRPQIEAKLDDIIDFSELGDAVHHKIKTYSSGMKLRLGFSCAVFTDPDILIIDEALSVGDGYFQFKCLQKIKSLLEIGVTFIYVSHNQDSVRALCQRGLLLEHGHLVMDDRASVVADEYRKRLFEKVGQWHSAMVAAEPLSSELIGADDGADRPPDGGVHDVAGGVAAAGPQFQISDAFARRVAATRAGNGHARITNVTISQVNKPLVEVLPFGAHFTIGISLMVNKPLRELAHVAVDISDLLENTVVNMNTLDAGITLHNYRSGSRALICFRLENRFCPGEYVISVIACGGERHPFYPATLNSGALYDYCIGGARFEVPRGSASKSLWGLVHIPYTAESTWVEQNGALADDVGRQLNPQPTAHPQNTFAGADKLEPR